MTSRPRDVEFYRENGYLVVASVLGAYLLEKSLYELRYIAENEVKRRLEAIAGVAAIQVKGGLVEEFLVAIDESCGRSLAIW